MSTLKTYNVDSGDTTNLVLRTNGTTAVTINGSTQAVTVAGTLTSTGALTATGGIQASGVTTNLYPLVSGTSVTASGTSVDLTGIPSWVKRITVMLSGVSTNGTSVPLIQVGTSGGIATTGYLGTGVNEGGTAANSTAGFPLRGTNAAANTFSGIATIANITGNTWVESGVFRAASSNLGISSGEVALSGALDRIRITTVNGTDTFDAGSINILYE